MFCNNDFLDFTGPLIHPHGTDITVKLFHFLPASHALSPVQLQSLVDDPLGLLGREQLGH